jgi:hypothetical protein
VVDAGFSTVGALFEQSEDTLTRDFGAENGARLWRLARGIDNEPVSDRLLTKSHGAGKTFPAKPLQNLAEVAHWLDAFSGELHVRLATDRRDNRRIPQNVTVHVGRGTPRKQGEKQKLGVFFSRSCSLRLQDKPLLFEGLAPDSNTVPSEQELGWRKTIACTAMTVVKDSLCSKPPDPLQPLDVVKLAMPVTSLSISCSNFVLIESCTIRKFFGSAPSGVDRFQSSEEVKSSFSLAETRRNENKRPKVGLVSWFNPTPNPLWQNLNVDPSLLAEAEVDGLKTNQSAKIPVEIRHSSNECVSESVTKRDASTTAQALSTPRTTAADTGQTCPVCLQIISGDNTALNAHLDMCLNYGALQIARVHENSAGNAHRVANKLESNASSSNNNKGKKRARNKDALRVDTKPAPPIARFFQK